MAAAPAQEQPLDRRPVARAFGRRPDQQLVEGMFAVVDLTARQTVLLLEVDRRQQLAADYRLRDARSVLLERRQRAVGQALARRVVPRRVQVVRRKMDQHGDDAVTFRREPGGRSGRHVDLERRLFR